MLQLTKRPADKETTYCKTDPETTSLRKAAIVNKDKSLFHLNLDGVHEFFFILGLTKILILHNFHEIFLQEIT